MRSLYTTMVAFATTKIGASVIVAILIGAGYWFFSSGSPEIETLTVQAGAFTQQVSVSGTVTPAQEVDLGFNQSGRIARVNVAVGQRVAAGTTLAHIDASDLYAQLQQREAALDVQKAKLAALKDGTRPEEIAVAQSDVTSDEAALSQANNALADAVRDAYIKTDNAIRNKVYQFVSNPRTNPQINIISSDQQAVVDANSGIVAIEAELVAWAADIQALSGTSADLLAQVGKAEARLAKAATLLGRVSRVLDSATLTYTTQATLDTYKSDVATGRANVSTASSALTTAVTAQKNAVAALDSSRKTLALKQAGTVQADVDAQLAQVKVAEADVANTRALIGKTLIVAPFAGVITKVDAKAGKIVSPNTPEISMITASTFQIESFVPEVNIALIKVGDGAVVTLDAYGSEQTFTAKVVSIDPAETIRDGVPTYRAILQFTDNDPRIRSGMTANIVITTAQKNDIVSIPQGLVLERNGKKYVKILDGETIIEREVTTGQVSSLGTIEILMGLAPGDVLVVGTGE